MGSGRLDLSWAARSGKRFELAYARLKPAAFAVVAELMNCGGERDDDREFAR